MVAKRKPRTQLIRALKDEHCSRCEQNCCDICAAYENRNYLWTAHLLTSATDDCEGTEKAYLELDPSAEELDKERDDLLEIPHLKCADCNAICWNATHGDMCDNCHEELVDPEHVEEEEEIDDDE